MRDWAGAWLWLLPFLLGFAGASVETVSYMLDLQIGRASGRERV